METKDLVLYLGLAITVGGVLWQLARSITQGATIKDLYDLERKIEGKIDDRDKKSVDSHAGLVSRREFEAYTAQMDKRFDKLEASVQRMDQSVETRLDAIGLTLSGISVHLTTTKGSK
jgi:hypothetical protein